VTRPTQPAPKIPIVRVSATATAKPSRYLESGVSPRAIVSMVSLESESRMVFTTQ
jgi:2-keto-3-deoxy-L-rhamnonate aldolase RhmA